MKIKEKLVKVKNEKKELTPAQKRKRKKKIIRWSIIGVIALIIAINMISNIGKTPSVENSTMSKISKETIATSIGATGMIEASDSKTVITKLSGLVVKKVYVENGDIVNAGDPICEFDVSDASKALAEQRQQERDAEQEKQEAIDDAQSQLDEANSNLAESQAKRDNAQKELDDYRAKFINNNVNNNVSNIANITNTNNPFTNMIGNAVNNTVNNTSSNTTTFDPNELSRLEQNVVNASNEVQANEATVNTLQRQLDAIKSADSSSISSLLGGLSGSSSMGSSSMLSALGYSSLSNEEIIANKLVTATASGTITNLSVNEDSIFQGSEVCKIECADALCVTSEIGEYDIPDIRTGMKVKIKTEATRNLEMDGIVTYVATTPTTTGMNSLSSLMSSSLMSGMMSGTTSSSSDSTGGVSYTIKIDILNQSDRLRLGMNAKLSIITDMRENVLAVPYDAVNTRDDGTKYIVTVADDFDLDKIAKEQKKEKMLEATRELEKEAIPNELLEGNTKEINVETGLEGTYNVEIKSDEIYENQKVIVNKSNVTNSIEALLQMMGAAAGT